MIIENEISNADFLAEIGRRIRHARIVARIKQDELARRSGISRSALIKLENGDGGVRVITLVSVLRSLGLLGGFEVAIRPVELTPNELAEIEVRQTRFVKRVRTRKTVAPKLRTWGDGTPVDGKKGGR